MFCAGSLSPPVKKANSPNKRQSEDNFVKHPFDADGAVFAATFDNNGQVTYRFRYVRTAAFTRERKKGLKLYNAMENTRSSPSTNKLYNDYPLPMLRHHLNPGANKQRKNTSNTSVIYWANKLLTFWEGGLPYKLDGLALSTEGKSQLGGVLTEDTHLCSRSVHDSKHHRLLMYSLKSEPSMSTLTTYEFNQAFKLVDGSQRDWAIPGYAILNDGITATADNWSVVVQPPINLNNVQYLLNKDPAKCVSIAQDSAAFIHLVPRIASPQNTIYSEIISIPIENDALGVDANVQCINAFENLQEKTVTLDLIRSNSSILSPSKATTKWPFISSLAEYQSIATSKSLWRYKIDINSRKIVSKSCISKMQLYFAAVDNRVSGQKHKFVYASVGGLGDEIAPPQGLATFNCDTNETQVWIPQAHEFCSQPIFAERIKVEPNFQATEGDGYLISILFNGQQSSSELVILDAQNVSRGPICRIALDSIDGGIPHGNYGFFATADTTDASWKSDEIERRAKLADKMELKGNSWNEVKSDFSGLGLRLDDWEEYFGDIL